MSFPASLQSFDLDGCSFEIYVPDVKQVQERYQRGDLPLPYWSQVWPSALALSRFLLAHPQLYRDKVVLELAGGLGLPSIVAARLAHSVLCSDAETEAMKLVALTARHHRLHNLSTQPLNWNQLPPGLQADVLLLSDINYEPEAFPALKKMLDHFLDRNTLIILATPQRLMAKDFIEGLLSHCSMQTEITVLHAGKLTPISIMVLH